MMQTARCEADRPTTMKVAKAIQEPMRVLKGPCIGEVCCPCGTVTGLNLKGDWPPLEVCPSCFVPLDSEG